MERWTLASSVLSDRRCRWSPQVQSVTRHSRTWRPSRSTSSSCYRGQRSSRALAAATLRRARWSPTTWRTRTSSRRRSSVFSARSGTCQTTTRRTTPSSASTNRKAERSSPLASIAPTYITATRQWMDCWHPEVLEHLPPRLLNMEFSAELICWYERHFCIKMFSFLVSFSWNSFIYEYWPPFAVHFFNLNLVLSTLKYINLLL